MMRCKVRASAGGVECGVKTDRTLRMGCRHEHIMEHPICQVHRTIAAQLLDEGGTAECDTCEKVDGHRCVMTVEFRDPVGT